MEQTTIHPCWFCGELSVEEIVLYPAQFDKVKGKLILKKNEVRGWVCAEHKKHVEESDGWRERQTAQKAARSKAAKKDQLTFGEAA